MSELKCPFCGKKLWWDEQDGIYRCMKKSACVMNYEGGTEKLWQAFICARKVLGIANKALQELKDVIACPPDVSYEDCVSTYADGVLQEITTALLDYKEPVVTHNKIEFPEYKDGLLEEFDKQFLEDGQDDDLTETALEQKDV